MTGRGGLGRGVLRQGGCDVLRKLCTASRRPLPPAMIRLHCREKHRDPVRICMANFISMLVRGGGGEEPRKAKYTRLNQIFKLKLQINRRKVSKINK